MARASVAAKSQKNQEAAARVRASTIGAGEPKVTKENYRIELMNAMTYYHTYEDDKNFRKWVQKYVGKDAEKLKKISGTKDHDLVHLGILIRLQEREQYLEERDAARINSKLEAIFNRVDKVVENEEPTAKNQKAPVVLSIAEKIEALASGHIGHIEGEVDSFILGGYKSTFSTKSYIESNELSAAVAKVIGNWFGRRLPEYKEALASKDLDGKSNLSSDTQQIIEAYGHMSKPQLKKFIAFYEGILADCAQRKVAVVRAPRKVKVKAPTEIVKSMKFLKDFPELKIEGLHPVKLIGAQEAWLYDTKYKKAIYFKSMDSAGLTVKGSTIIGFDTSISETRTIRKPEEWMQVKQAKRELSAAWKKLTTKVAIPTGRVNENIVIVSVF